MKETFLVRERNEESVFKIPSELWDGNGGMKYLMLCENRKLSANFYIHWNITPAGKIPAPLVVFVQLFLDNNINNMVKPPYCSISSIKKLVTGNSSETERKRKFRIIDMRQGKEVWRNFCFKKSPMARGIIG